MRRLLIVGNWKMNLNRKDASKLASAISEQTAQYPEVDLAVCPPFVYIDSVAQAIGEATLGLGSQNVYHEANGAFTGEISVSMLQDFGCQYVILGHSERRHILGETDDDINKKVQAVLKAGLTPIVCVGELLEQREAGKTSQIIREQFDGSLAGLSDEDMAKIVIAYEPVWAIGTGKVATPEQAEDVHLDLRKMLANRYNGELSENIRILYGGSVKASNSKELLAQPNIDGALVGGASLKVDDFLGIVSSL